MWVYNAFIINQWQETYRNALMENPGHTLSLNLRFFSCVSQQSKFVKTGVLPTYVMEDGVDDSFTNQ